jgi:glycosyltransferase involved in cell wall biosynthesis
MHVALNAHLLSGEASYRSAGIHGYIFNTLAYLPDVDSDLAYTVLAGIGMLPERQGWNVIRSRLPTRHPMVRILWEQCFAPWVLRRLSPDLLHGMAFATPLLWRGPSVVTIYDLSFLRYPQRLGYGRRLYLQWATRVSARRARRLITISESSKAEISALLGVDPQRVDVAVPGVAECFRPQPLAEVAKFRANQKLPARFILYLGTLEPRKNLDTLLRAYARLSQRSQVKLILAGARGWQTESLFALIESLGLGSDVVLPGYIPNQALPMWYNAADLFVYPSVYEGFGLPLLEAMACGTPVVASYATSLPEAVGPDGILLPPLDIDAWVESLARLLSLPALRSDLGLQGQARARGFSWENTARQTVASYRRALGGET